MSAGARALSVSGLANAVRAGAVPHRAVAITFDGGYRGAVYAASLLAQRGLQATFFCTAGRLDDDSHGRSAPPRASGLELATGSELAGLATAGFEIGSHGVTYEALTTSDHEVAQREVLESKRILERITSTDIRVFALPYGLPPSRSAQMLLEGAYDAVCTATPGYAHSWSNPLALPRVDIRYVDSPRLLRWALEGNGRAYLLARRLASKARHAGTSSRFRLER